MTVGELVDLLDAYDEDTPVMIAHQPNYPLAETLGGAVHTSDRDRGDVECALHGGYLVGHLVDGEPCGWEPDEEHCDDDEPCVWLVAGGHAWDRSPYAPRWVFEAVELPL
jgi:hypothetical protein